MPDRLPHSPKRMKRRGRKANVATATIMENTMTKSMGSIRGLHIEAAAP